MEQTKPTEETKHTNTAQGIIPPDHPLASLIGTAKNEPLWEMLWEEIHAVRERINQEERERLDREEAVQK